LPSTSFPSRQAAADRRRLEQLLAKRLDLGETCVGGEADLSLESGGKAVAHGEQAGPSVILDYLPLVSMSRHVRIVTP
jgi:hypothetical protein